MKKKFHQYTRSKKNVYIIPTKKGFKYIGVNFFMLLIAMAYANNMALLITFSMFVYFILQMFATHRIINQLHLQSHRIPSEYADNSPHIICHFSDDISKHDCAHIDVSLENKQKVDLKAINASIINNKTLKFKIKDPRRGKYSIDHLKFSTHGGSGLFYVWRFFKREQSYYIYPKKVFNNKEKFIFDINKPSLQTGSNFKEFIPYHEGLSAKYIDWKKYAAKDELYWKKQDAQEDLAYLIDYNLFQGDKELRLSQICYLCFIYSKNHYEYSLKMPHKVIPISKGQNHLKQTLETLSEY